MNRLFIFAFFIATAQAWASHDLQDWATSYHVHSDYVEVTLAEDPLPRFNGRRIGGVVHMHAGDTLSWNRDGMYYEQKLLRVANGTAELRYSEYSYSRPALSAVDRYSRRIQAPRIYESALRSEKVTLKLVHTEDFKASGISPERLRLE